MTKTRITADVLRELPDEEVKKLLTELGPQKAEELQHDWSFWARDTQLLPTDNKDPRLVEKGLTKTQWNTWVCLAGRGWGKDLTVSTPVFTPSGWTTMGEIRVGDYVFAWDGSPTKVVDTYRPNPRKLVKFRFSDGTELTSSVEHDWVTWTHSERKCYNRNVGNGIPEDWPNWSWEYKDRWGHTRNQIGPKKRTTQDIVDTFTQGKRKDRNHSIPLAKPLQGSHKDHLEDPYYLGLWLGDGISDSVHTMACGKEDEWWLLENYPNFEDKGNCVYRAPAGSFPFMSALGLRKNKHFDEDWLQASFEQRLLLLQGLMDSDGCADKSGVEFCSANKSLANGVFLLARTLGQKPTLSEGVARLYGKDCGPKYRVTWRPTQGINPFRLPRKANKVSFGGAQESRNLHRMIVGYEFVDYEPTVCISVEHKDHLFLAGEGLIPTHNTKAGVETVREWVKQGNGIIHCVAPTKGDVRKVMVEGDSGLLNSCWKGDKTHRGAAMGYPTWSPTNNTLTWENGAKAVFFSAEDPERLRGPQAHKAWCDEICAWNNAQDTWDMMQFGLRLGQHPQTLVTTTPKTTKLIRNILSDDKTIVSRGSTYDNAANLAGTFLEAVRKQYEGTRLGRQELYAEILDEASGALWSRSLLASCEVDRESVPDLNRIVVSIDPAITSNAESDMTGIVVAGVDINGTAYVLEDATGKYTPQQWASKAVELYNRYEADRVVAEKNQGGDMVKHTLHTECPTLPIKLVHASRGKMARAEPVSALYEQGRVKHVKGLNELEDQMVQWEPLGSIGSPDRLDALVWAITDLSLKGWAKPTMQLAYSSAVGLLRG